MARIAALVTEPVDRPDSMKSLDNQILNSVNRNYYEIQAMTDAVKQLVSLKFLRTALFTRSLPHYCLL